ncbi:MAG: tetratricopeptide repeat protein, partial [Acidobacteriota bacterium]
ADYREALALLATAGLPAARAAVGALERRHALGGDPEVLNRLATAEVRLGRELARRAPETALALAMLHTELYHEYARRREHLLQTHALRLAATLAELLAGAGERDDRLAAARMAASLAGFAQAQRATDTSERLFRRALELDPRQLAALVGLAASRERVGGYEEAARLLRAAMEVEPAHSESRLRLAVNLARLGQTREAAALLERCRAPGNPPWVRAIATQELAQRAIDEERLAQAEELLEAGIAELPADETLPIQLAFVLDRQGRPLDAREVVSRLATRGHEGESSARWRYSQWPHQDLAEARRQLAAAATRATEALARQLTSLPANGAT